MYFSSHSQTLFVKWLKTNQDQVEGLISQAKQGKLKSSEYKLSYQDNQLHSFHLEVTWQPVLRTVLP